MTLSLEKEINDTFSNLGDRLFSFNNEQLNTVPFEGSWTGGQVVDHITRSFEGYSQLMNGPAARVDRAADEKVQPLRDLFLNLSVKFNAPDFIIPGSGPFDRDTQLARLDQLKDDMLKSLSLTPGEELAGAELPGFKRLTRLEWQHFYVTHTERHSQQLKNIFDVLK